MLKKTITKCTCGKRLKYAVSPFVTTERRVCPKCGKIHYVDYAPIDWQKNFTADMRKRIEK